VPRDRSSSRVTSVEEVLRNSSSSNRRKDPKHDLKFGQWSSRSRMQEDHSVSSGAWSRSNGDNRPSSNVLTALLKRRQSERPDRRDSSSRRVSVSRRPRRVPRDLRSRNLSDHGKTLQSSERSLLRSP
jgi:hypothetical protein